jgi:hypothetical protein
MDMDKYPVEYNDGPTLNLETVPVATEYLVIKGVSFFVRSRKHHVEEDDIQYVEMFLSHGAG